MTTNHLQRAQFYLEHSRHDEAMQEIGFALGHDPNDAYARALLAFCLVERKQDDEALKQAQWAVHCAPDLAYAHFAVAYVQCEANRYKQADAAIREAIRIYPLEADYHALRAQIACGLRQWRVALEAAETGLQMDARHVGCTNLRALALRNLGQPDHAAVVLDSALAHNPENAYTHVNRGYAYLQAGDHRNALLHFREALRLDPGSAAAREGVLGALNARNPIYRLLLRYFFFMSRIPRGMQFVLLFGGWYVVNVASNVSSHNPGLAPYIVPVRIGYIVFVFLAWTANPLFNVLLRFDPLGRLALTRQQWIATDFMIFCLIGVCAGLAGWLRNGSDTALLILVFSAILMIPIAAACESRGPKRRLIFGIYAGTLALLSLVTILLTAFASGDAADPFFSATLLGFIAFTWLANFIPDR
jgi:tetratricopeptide (TPR) repeat protein